MKKKYEFYAATRYIGSDIKEVIEIEFDDYEDMTPEDIEKEVNEYFNEWLFQNIESGWEEIE